MGVAHKLQVLYLVLKLLFYQIMGLMTLIEKSNRKAMNRNWSNQNANPALKTKAGNK